MWHACTTTCIFRANQDCFQRFAKPFSPWLCAKSVAGGDWSAAGLLIESLASTARFQAFELLIVAPSSDTYLCDQLRASQDMSRHGPKAISSRCSAPSTLMTAGTTQGHQASRCRHCWASRSSDARIRTSAARRLRCDDLCLQDRRALSRWEPSCSDFVAHAAESPWAPATTPRARPVGDAQPAAGKLAAQTLDHLATVAGRHDVAALLKARQAARRAVDRVCALHHRRRV